MSSAAGVHKALARSSPQRYVHTMALPMGDEDLLIIGENTVV